MYQTHYKLPRLENLQVPQDKQHLKIKYIYSVLHTNNDLNTEFTTWQNDN